MKFLIKLFLILLLCPAVKGQLRLPALVADHMVLQRDTKIPVWGWAKPGDQIEITFKSKVYHTATAINGKWLTKLDQSTAGGPFELTVKGSGSKVIIKDILVGDVWLCSGQSNMVYDFNQARAKKLYAGEIETSANDQIRQIVVNRITAAQPADNIKTNGWKPASPQTLNAFSIVAYFFARNVFEKYKVPIGLINSSWGGTKAEAWTSEDGLKDFPQFAGEISLLKDTAAVNAKIKARQLQIDNWNRNKVTGDNGAGQLPSRYNVQDLSTSLYNGMIAPLIPYAIKGAIWYQGENNDRKGYEYRTLFPAMIANWRSNWGQGDFPFVYQQLVNFKKEEARPTESYWAELREAQLLTLQKSAHTAMAVGIDVGEADDIHPVNKKDVGNRLALAARKLAYGEKGLTASGPVYKTMKITGNKVVLKFTNADLVAKGGDLKYFAIAGEDKVFHWAAAVIKGKQIEVFSKDVAKPVAVRYAWADNPAGANLYSKTGLPASPFRTDDWPGISAPKK